MDYSPNRGGHAPVGLRSAFHEHLDLGCDVKLYRPVKVGYWGQPECLRWLIGQLWNCTDILPDKYCTQVGVRAGSTYAVAVRKLLRQA
jgi:hypothetical protein